MAWASKSMNSVFKSRWSVFFSSLPDKPGETKCWGFDAVFVLLLFPLYLHLSWPLLAGGLCTWACIDEGEIIITHQKMTRCFSPCDAKKKDTSARAHTAIRSVLAKLLSDYVMKVEFSVTRWRRWCAITLSVDRTCALSEHVSLWGLHRGGGGAKRRGLFS